MDDHRVPLSLSPGAVSLRRKTTEAGFGEAATGCQAGDSAMQNAFLSNGIFPSHTQKSILRTESVERHEKHLGNCKAFFKCEVLFLLPSISPYRM